MTIRRFSLVSNQLVARPDGAFCHYSQVEKDHRRALRAETALVNLLAVINDDKDSGFFICEEARECITDAQNVLKRSQE